MPIKVIVEFQARPGARAELRSLLASISTTHGSQVPGFLGSTVYEVLDSPDGLVEIAEWDSPEAQKAAVQQAMAEGLYAPVVELVAAPFRATRIGPSLEGERPMWAQLIRVRVQPGADLRAMADLLKRYEQEDSGLLRELFMQEEGDPDSAYILALFESEEKARRREQDPRRSEGQQATRELMAETLAGPPEFTDLTVIAEWVP